jgi:hypothetical protein
MSEFRKAWSKLLQMQLHGGNFYANPLSTPITGTPQSLVPMLLGRSPSCSETSVKG